MGRRRRRQPLPLVLSPPPPGAQAGDCSIILSGFFFFFFFWHVLLPFQTNQPDLRVVLWLPPLLPCVCTAGSGLGAGGAVLGVSGC